MFLHSTGSDVQSAFASFGERKEYEDPCLREEFIAASLLKLATK